MRCDAEHVEDIAVEVGGSWRFLQDFCRDRETAVRELGEGFEIDAALKNRKGVGIVAPILVETLIKLGRIADASAICGRAREIAPADRRLLELKRGLDRRRDIPSH